MIKVISYAKPKDHTALWIGLAAFLFLVAGFAAAWYYAMHYVPKMRHTPAFVETGDVLIAVEGYTIATRLSVQTASDDAGWAEKNRSAIRGVISKALSEGDPKKMQTPSDLGMLQDNLKQVGNQALNTQKIQGILLTDFLIKRDEY